MIYNQFIQSQTLQKKVYHYLIEKNKQTNEVGFIFKLQSDINKFKEYFLDILRNRFKNLTFYVIFDDGFLSERFFKKYIYYFRIGNIIDLNDFNIDILGIPNLKELPRDYGQNPIYYFFGNNEYIVIYIDDNFNVVNNFNNFNNLDYLVLMGNKIKCAEFINNYKLNPFIVYNNMLVYNILIKSKTIFIRESIIFPYNEFNYKVKYIC